MAGCRARPPAPALLLTMLLAGCAGGERPPPAPIEPAALVPLGAEEDGTYRSARWHQQTRDAFRRLDRNRDGKIDLDEIRAGLEVLDVDGDGYVSRLEAAGLVEAGDRDGDGRLSRAELERLPSLRLETDRDGDGRIGALELSLARTDEFVRVDRNRDGRLTIDEWSRAPRFTLFRF